MKLLPYGVATFSRIINDGYVYIDKTQEIYNLYGRGIYYHFLSRPRRFGKSLLISTLKEFFKGNRDLFKGLWIDRETDYAWSKHPVVHIDMSALPHRNNDELHAGLTKLLRDSAREFGIVLDVNNPEDGIVSLVKELCKQGGRVAILVDEYDKPLLDHINDLSMVVRIRDVLQSFYSALKSLDEYIKVVFITGVTKFNKTSIFSGLNNVKDISFDPVASKLLGYTKSEIQDGFAQHLNDFSQTENRSQEEIMNEMQEWYNGYRFSKSDVKVFNPFSVLSYLEAKAASNYWFESGAPAFLVHLIREQYAILESLEEYTLSADDLSKFDVEKIPLEAILFQTGYLTIKSYIKDGNLYKLTYPNLEVKHSFAQLVVTSMVNGIYGRVGSLARELAGALKHDDLDTFFRCLKTLFAHITYHQRVKEEAYYHALFQFLGTLLGFNLQSEVATDKGRIDLVLTTAAHIYLFEIKHNATSEIALNQIETKKYYERYLLDGRKIVLIGMSCNDVDGPVEIEWKARYL